MSMIVNITGIIMSIECMYTAAEICKSSAHDHYKAVWHCQNSWPSKVSCIWSAVMYIVQIWTVCLLKLPILLWLL